MKHYYDFFLKICLFFVPLSVSVFGAKWHYLFLILSIFLWVISRLVQPFIYLSYYFKIYIFLFFTPIILSLAFGLPVGTFYNFNFFDYTTYFYEIIGRLSSYILILFFCLIFSETVFCGSSRGHEIEKTKNLLFYYWLGLFLFISFCYWQIASEYFGLVNFPFETRSHIHSLSISPDSFFGFRVTGIAREPSYLTPLLIDFILISLFVIEGFKKILVCFFYALIPLLLTFSLGGYFNLFIILFSAISFYTIISILSLKINSYALLSILCIFLGLVFFTAKLISLGGADLIFGRFSGAFDISKGARLYMWVMPFVWLTTYSIINVFLGLAQRVSLY
ncbi:hypothetical protein ABA45_11755 [Marinobacter psychrophilus]|uniref:Uncharacterized protein n=1 Tax=Marinobacter psychrophilus TaxID=330734 RepID=A0A0H4I5I4_9GAMM|nr:hypothetical protein [Marinobacter psychrophilus]AKO52993.1 hypothetical protein ABA45_11755 [Marinobacter psychrophilus]